MIFKFWHKMTIIFGFLDEKCIRMEVCSMTFWLHPIKTSVEHSHLYRDLYEKMAFWPQWRHQWYELKLQSPLSQERSKLWRCVFFVHLAFLSTFKISWDEKTPEFPFKPFLDELSSFSCFRPLNGIPYAFNTQLLRQNWQKFLFWAWE